MHRQLFGERHPSVAADLLNLADLQQDLGYYGEAERLARQALDITRPYYGNDHPQTANNLTVLGRALHFEKRYDEGRRRAAAGAGHSRARLREGASLGRRHRE